MIKGVDDIKENPPSPELQVSAAEQPTVLVPVSAEDFERHRRRVRNMLIAAVLLVILAVGWVYKWSTDPLRARESYDAGLRLYKVARYPQAILSLDRAIALAPDFADAYLLRGRARAGMPDIPRAIENFTEVIRLRPNDAQAYVERGLAYLELKNYQASKADCVKALMLDPKFAAAYNLRGTLERAEGDGQKALEDFTRAVNLQPDLDNYYQRGATYQALGDHKKAIVDFTEAIRFSPFSPQAYFARAESKRVLGDNAGAQRDHLQGRILDGR